MSSETTDPRMSCHELSPKPHHRTGPFLPQDHIPSAKRYTIKMGALHPAFVFS